MLPTVNLPSNKLVAADFETLATGFNFFGGINFGGCFLAGRIDGFLNLKVFEFYRRFTGFD